MENQTEFIKELLTETLSRIGVPAGVSITNDAENIRAEITAENPGLLIGYHGEALSSLQLFLSLAAFKKFGEWSHLTLDVGGYRREREDKLKGLTLRAVDKVRFLCRPVVLPPMTSFERRVVHTVVAEMPDVASESTGEGRDRRVVISLKTENKVSSQ